MPNLKRVRNLRVSIMLMIHRSMTMIIRMTAVLSMGYSLEWRIMKMAMSIKINIMVARITTSTTNDIMNREMKMMVRCGNCMT